MRDQAGNWLSWALSGSGCVGLRKSLSLEPPFVTAPVPVNTWEWRGEITTQGGCPWLRDSCIPVHGKTGLWGVLWLLVFTLSPPLLCWAVSGAVEHSLFFSDVSSVCWSSFLVSFFTLGGGGLEWKPLSQNASMEQFVAVLLLFGNLRTKKIRFVLSYTNSGGLG